MEVLKTGKFRQWQAGVTLSLGMWALGNALAWTAVTTSEYSNISGVSDEEMMDIFIFTILIGCLTGIYMITRPTILLFSFFLSIAWIGLALAEDTDIFVAARCVIGVCSSGITVAALVYISEISEDENRSKFISWNLVVYYFGLLYTSVLGSNSKWQTTAGLCSLPNILLFIGMLNLPETPRCLLASGTPRREKASKSLQWFRGSSETEVEEEMHNLENDVAKSQASWRNRWGVGTWKPLLIYVGLLTFSRFSGQNFLIFYSVYFFEKFGKSLEPHSISMIISAVQAISTGLGAILMLYLKRKTQLIVSQMVMCVVLITLGVYYYLIDKRTFDESTLSWLPLFCMFVFLISYSIGAGLLTWVLMVELCSPRVKSVTVSFCLAMYFAMGHLETRVFFKWIEHMPFHGILFTYGGLALIGVVYLAAALPETKGKTAQEIQYMFSGTKKPVSVKPVQVINFEVEL